MRGSLLLNQANRSREQLSQSRELFEQALRIEPELPRALLVEVNNRWSNAPAEQLARATAAINRVLTVFPNDAMAHFQKGVRSRGP
jgi:adenylate cyclase